MGKRRAVLLFAAALAAAAALAWFAQARLILLAADRFSGGSLRAARAKGTLASGLYFYDVTFRTPAFRGTAAEVFLRAAPAGVFSGRPALSEFRAVSPRVTLTAAGKGGAAGFPPWLPPVRLAVISDGGLEIGGKTISGINCRLSYASGKIDILSCAGNYAGSSAVFSGAYSAESASARGRLAYPRGETAGDFEYSMLGVRHVFSVIGASAGAPFRFDGEADGENWKAALSLKDSLPLNAFRASLEPVKLRSADISAYGKGFSPAALSARGKFSIDEKPGSAGAGVFSFDRGGAVLKASYVSGRISAWLDAAAANGRLSGNWRAAGGGDFRLPGGKQLSVSGAKADCSLGGSVKAPSVSCKAEAGRMKSGDYAAGGAGLSGAFTAGSPETFKFRVSLLAPSLYKVTLDSASLRAEGSMEDNNFSLDAFFGTNSAGLKGTSSFKKGIWRAVLKDLSFLRAPDWRLCSPAAVSVSSRGGVEVSGFCFASGKSELSFSGIFKALFPEKIRAVVAGFRLSELEKAGLTGLKPNGVVNASIEYPAAGTGEGTFSLSAENLELGGIELGAAGARGTFTPNKARLDNAEWKIRGGKTQVSGWAAVSGGKTEADFSIKASSMNIAPLLAFVPQISAREAWLDGESRFLLSGGVLKGSGAMDLSSPGLGLPSLGLELDSAGVRLDAGDLSSVRFAASARRREGEITAEGSLSAGGPLVRIGASKMPFSHPSGLSGIARADLLLSGSWKEAVFSGKINLREARFDLEQWDKFRPAEGTSPSYEAMSIDLKIDAERNAWYRDGANAVEVKGALLLKKDHYHPLLVLGTIDALKGYYGYFGNTFAVNSGRMTFAGESPLNPVIQAAATREEHGGPIKVYLNVSGTARSPQLTFSSDPPMEQRDIISFLVTGKPLYELNSSRGNGAQRGPAGNSVAAQNLAAGYISQKAAAAVRKKIDIDMMNLKVNNDNRADLAVGRYMTKNLFVSYGQALGQGGEKRVSAEYAITRHWSLEGKNSSDGRYVADLLFKYGIK
jgi:hypothetical protein